jgi:nuclear pore complex protein Nup85
MHSELVSAVVRDLPPDSTDMEDQMMMHFFSSNFPKALERAVIIDPWLGAHLADLMQAEGLVSHLPSARYGAQ